MKKALKILLIIFIVSIAGGWLYWQYNKKHIVKKVLENAISGKTDSLYYIHYDSSAIDELNGNASFYNVTLQSDSLEQQLLNFDTASTNSVFNVHIAEVSIRGTDIPGLVSNSKVKANSIRIVKPIVYVISSGRNKGEKLTRADTLAIYEKMLGKFKSIRAGEIIIQDGQLNFTRKIDEPYISISGINIDIKNIVIDSTRDYDNIISYFIKDVNASVKNAIVKNEENNSTLTFTGIKYDAFQKTLRLDNFQQKENVNNKIAFDINKVLISGLATDSFILNKQLKAELFSADRGILTFYSRKGKDSLNDHIEIDNNFFDEALLNKIAIDHFKVVVYNQGDQKQKPFTLTNIKFTASDIQHVYSGTSIKNLVGRSNWDISADGFTFFTNDKIYKMVVGAFKINKATGKAHLDSFSVKPLLTEEAFVKTLKEQRDLYNITIRNIDIAGINAMKLITERALFAETMMMSPTIKVFCDRTIPPFTGSKVGNYPHQLIQKIEFPVYVKKIIAKDGYISYTERGKQSHEKGTVFFGSANGTIENISNMPVYLKKNDTLLLNAKARLMGVADLTTRWHLPLNSRNGSFFITGNATTFSGDVLNTILEPLALASIKKGVIKAIDFNIEGNDNDAKGMLKLLYNDLKLEALKNDSADLKKRSLISFFANLVIKDDNPKNGNTRQGEIDIERDKTRSFFNLVWQGIFKAAKRTALGKDDGK